MTKRMLIAGRVAKVWIALLVTELLIFGFLADSPTWWAGVLGGAALGALLLYFILDDAWREVLTDWKIGTIVMVGSTAIFGWPLAITPVRRSLTLGAYAFLGTGFLLMLIVVVAFYLLGRSKDRSA